MGSRILLNVAVQQIKTAKFEASLYYRIRNLSSNVSNNFKSTELYSAVAQNYDKLNDVATLGLHRSWREAVVDSVPINVNSKILDAPGGTGANTLRLLEKARKQSVNSDFFIEVIDINPAMLKIGQDNYKNSVFNQKLVKFSEGDIQNLPFCDNSFDTVIFSFALRSGIDLQMVFNEFYRVLKPKGKVVAMDFHYYQHPTLIQRLYCTYVKHVAPIIEKIFFDVTPGSMDYVVHEIREVVGKTDIEGLMKKSKFQNVEFKTLSLEIASLTIGYKLP